MGNIAGLIQSLLPCSIRRCVTTTFVFSAAISEGGIRASMARSVLTALCSSKETANFCREKRHFLSFWFRTIPFHPPQLPWRQKGIGFSTAILSTDGFALNSVKDVFLQLSLNSATRRRQEPQTGFGGQRYVSPLPLARHNSSQGQTGGIFPPSVRRPFSLSTAS